MKLRYLFDRKLKPDEFVAPNGEIAKLVEDSEYKTVFVIRHANSSTYYNFNKYTGEKRVNYIPHPY